MYPCDFQNYINKFCFSFSKISAHEFERGGLLKPIVNTIDGTPTFLSVCPQNDSALCSASNAIGSTNNNSHRPQRLSRNELRHLDEKQLIFELVRYRMLLFNLHTCTLQNANEKHPEDN